MLDMKNTKRQKIVTRFMEEVKCKDVYLRMILNAVKTQVCLVVLF